MRGEHRATLALLCGYFRLEDSVPASAPHCGVGVVVQLSPFRSFPFIAVTTIDRIPRLCLDRLAESRMRAHTSRFFRSHPASARLAEWLHSLCRSERGLRAYMREVYARPTDGVRPHPGSARRLMNARNSGLRVAGPRLSFLPSSLPCARLFSRARRAAE